jgi:hypothetical protein
MTDVQKRDDWLMDQAIGYQQRAKRAIDYIENMALTDNTLMLIAIDIRNILTPKPPRA